MSATERIRDDLVCVSRNGHGDWQRVLVPVSEVRFVCMAVTRGGDEVPLAEPELAVYVDPAWVPDAWRSGEHPRRPGIGMKLMVETGEAEFTAPDVLEALRSEGAKQVHSREYAERKRAKLARRRAAEVGATREDI